jgi:outer membrane lipoprotein-sorting protein
VTLLLALAGMAVVPSAELPAEIELSANEVIAKSEAAYAAVKTYYGTTTVRRTTDFGDRKRDEVSTAKITFVRPGKVRIRGKTADGHPFMIVSDGTKTWTSWALRNKGEFEEVKSVRSAGMGGVALGAAEGIPAALMKGDGAQFFGDYPFFVPRRSPTKVAGLEKIDGNVCYELAAKNPKFGNVTLWIDAKSFLLRQMKSESTHVGPIKSISSIFSFTIDKVDDPVDERLFADPTQ